VSSPCSCQNEKPPGQKERPTKDKLILPTTLAGGQSMKDHNPSLSCIPEEFLRACLTIISPTRPVHLLVIENASEEFFHFKKLVDRKE
jgi:hypothetical protein